MQELSMNEIDLVGGGFSFSDFYDAACNFVKKGAPIIAAALGGAVVGAIVTGGNPLGGLAGAAIGAGIALAVTLKK